jgi:hypothetical protein
MLKRSIIHDDIVDLLNELLKIDHDAIYNLFMGSKVPCNEEMANHPTVQCGIAPSGGYTLSALGILNGLFGTDNQGYGIISMQVDSDRKRIYKFYRRTVPLEDFTPEQKQDNA